LKNTRYPFFYNDAILKPCLKGFVSLIYGKPPMCRIIFFSQASSPPERLQHALAATEFCLEQSGSAHELQRLLAERQHPSLLLLDADQLARLGGQTCQQLILHARHHGTSTLMFSSDDDSAVRLQALEMGCTDFITTTHQRPVIESKLRTHIRLQSLQHRVDEQECAVQYALSELSAVQDAAILCLAAIARVRDHSTGNHILRTQHYVKALAEQLRYHPRFSDALNDETIELLYKSAALHDIGKVAVPDSILQKPAKLTPEEYTLMQKHTLFGYQAMHTAETLLERSAGEQAARFLKIAQEVTLSHHERWDGSGYPQGLKGDQIPVVARLMAVADVYDAVSSRRPYKPALEHAHVVQIIQQGRGSHFDPDVVDAFLDLQDTFEHIATVLEDRFPSLTDLTLHAADELILPPVSH
jgi:putative two-component system response regulator